MFKTKIENDNNNLSKIIEQLKKENEELKNELVEVANNSGNVIIKQLPNGLMEFNGEAFDNTSEVEYYNSSKATYTELTMFRLGKEAKQREMNKLIEIHMDEIDELTSKISNLEQDISILQANIKNNNESIEMYKKSEDHLKHRLDKKYKDLDDTIKQYENEKRMLTERYENCIKMLNEDIENWKRRYLTINNTSLDGTIITKYGKVLGKEEN